MEPALTATIVVPGNFDGVHLGHRDLLRRAKSSASARNLGVTALFFFPHPSAVVSPGTAPKVLTPPLRRRELLQGAGADQVATVHFDETFSQQSPRDFVNNVLMNHLRTAHLVVGPDFRFGHRAAGNVQNLTDLGAELGFTVETAPPCALDGIRVSSTKIRSLLQDGKVEAAARMLGRYHDLDGTVVEGDQRGRTLGFPTANLACDPQLQLPSPGVYAVAAQGLDQPLPDSDPHREALAGAHPAVANIGLRPTFVSGSGVPDLRLEVHLLSFRGNLYGQRLRIAFVARLRDERKFDGIAALKRQIALDVSASSEALSSANGPWLRQLVP